MGLRRRLSRLWDETTDGVLTGPGINVESVSTDDADIGQLISALDAAGFDLNNVGASDIDDLTVGNSVEINANQGTPSSPNNWTQFGDGPQQTGQLTSSTSVSGDNTATDLINMFPATTGLAIVTGKDPNSNTAFSDCVSIARITERTVIGSSERSSPGVRSYGNDGNMLQIAIDDSGVTYDVTAQVIGGNN